MSEQQQQALEKMRSYAASVVPACSVSVSERLQCAGAFSTRPLQIELHPTASPEIVFPHEMAHAVLYSRRFSLPINFQNSGAGSSGAGGLFTHHSPAFIVLAAALAADFLKEEFSPMKHFSPQCFGPRWLYASPHFSAVACALYFSACFDFIGRHAPPPLVAADAVARMYVEAMRENLPPTTQVFIREPAALLGFGWIED